MEWDDDPEWGGGSYFSLRCPQSSKIKWNHTSSHELLLHTVFIMSAMFFNKKNIVSVISNGQDLIIHNLLCPSLGFLMFIGLCLALGEQFL